MTAQEFLMQGYKINEKIKNLMLQLEATRGRIPSPSYGSAVSRGRGEFHSTTESNALKAIKLEKLISQEVERLEKIQIAIFEAIQSLDDIDEQLILRYRYIETTDNGNPLTWEMVAEKIGYCSSHTHRIYKRALLNLEKLNAF